MVQWKMAIFEKVTNIGDTPVFSLMGEEQFLNKALVASLFEELGFSEIVKYPA